MNSERAMKEVWAAEMERRKEIKIKIKECVEIPGITVFELLLITVQTNYRQQADIRFSLWTKKYVMAGLNSK